MGPSTDKSDFSVSSELLPAFLLLCGILGGVAGIEAAWSPVPLAHEEVVADGLVPAGSVMTAVLLPLQHVCSGGAKYIPATSRALCSILHTSDRTQPTAYFVYVGGEK